MGMYTEIIVKINFTRIRIGSDNFDILDYIFNPNTNLKEEDLTKPDHEFFKCSRWDSVGNMNSFYHHPARVNSWHTNRVNNDSVYLFSRNDLKDYGGEIDKFFNWLNTLEFGCDGEFIGYSLYEEDNIPIIFNKG